MWYGGGRMIKLYQCGLTEQRLYTGEIDGIWRQELADAMKKCVRERAATRSRRRALPRRDVVGLRDPAIISACAAWTLTEPPEERGVPRWRPRRRRVRS